MSVVFQPFKVCILGGAYNVCVYVCVSMLVCVHILVFIHYISIYIL